jgi:CHASE1-domain containing sensor protein
MKFKALPIRTPNAKVKATRRRIGMLALLFAVLLAVTLGTVGLSRSSSQASQKKYRATKEIVLDKATGALRKPTAEETDAMVAQISVLTNRSSDGLTTRDYANGSKGMNLEGRFQGVVLGRAIADGSTEVRCVFTMNEAADFLGLEQE